MPAAAGGSFPAMASQALKRVLLLCMLMWLPVFTAGHRGRLIGGWTDRSVSDSDVQKAAEFAVDAYNQRSDSTFRLLEILRARSQVVAGMKYSLEVLLVSTLCDKGSGQGLAPEDLNRCPFSPEAQQQKQVCTFYVWSRPWLNDLRLTKVNCEPANS